MSTYEERILEILDKLVDNPEELAKYRDNPTYRRHYAENVLKAIELPPSLEVSTVLTLKAIANPSNPVLFNPKTIGGEAILTTDEHVLLVEIPESGSRKYPILSNSWVFEIGDDIVGFVLFVQFAGAIPQNPDYKPILKIACKEHVESQPEVRKIPFAGIGEVNIDFRRYLLVKKYCPLHINLGEGENDGKYEMSTKTLTISLNYREIEAQNQQ